MSTLKIRSKGDSVSLLQELLNKNGYNLKVDGVFGKGTEKAVIDFQRKFQLVADGIVGPKTWTVLQNKSTEDLERMEYKFLSEQDLIDLSESLGLELAAIKSVNEVESSGRGFLTDGRPKILFEGHIFWNRLKKQGMDPQQYREGNEEILYPKWTSRFYKGGAAEYERLNKAKTINEDAAYESASWGSFQIMGYHYLITGFENVQAFVKANYESERQQLNAFGKFIEHEGLVKFLKNRDWAKFAYRYNGPGYKKNKYDEKLRKAFEKYTS